MTSNKTTGPRLAKRPLAMSRRTCGERLNAQDPAAEPTVAPPRAGCGCVVTAAVMIQCRVRASWSNSCRVPRDQVVAVPVVRIPRSLKAEDMQIGALIGEHIQVVQILVPLNVAPSPTRRQLPA